MGKELQDFNIMENWEKHQALSEKAEWVVSRVVGSMVRLTGRFPLPAAVIATAALPNAASSSASNEFRSFVCLGPLACQ